MVQISSKCRRNQREIGESSASLSRRVIRPSLAPPSIVSLSPRLPPVSLIRPRPVSPSPPRPSAALVLISHCRLQRLLPVALDWSWAWPGLAINGCLRRNAKHNHVAHHARLLCSPGCAQSLSPPILLTPSRVPSPPPPVPREALAPTNTPSPTATRIFPIDPPILSLRRSLRALHPPLALSSTACAP